MPDPVPARVREELAALRKAAGQMPHGGGKRLPAGGESYSTVLRWLHQGSPKGSAGGPDPRRPPT